MIDCVGFESEAMYIEELKGGGVGSGEEGNLSPGNREFNCRGITPLDAKRVLIGAGARALFYPTLLYNVIRNKLQAEFRWWDKVDEVQISFYCSIFVFIYLSCISYNVYRLGLLVYCVMFRCRV